MALEARAERRRAMLQRQCVDRFEAYVVAVTRVGFACVPEADKQ
jgi:hypothetical protein